MCVCEKEGTCVPVQGRHAVNGLEAATCRHHVEAVSAIAGDVEVVFGVAVLHHHDEPCPPVGQVIASHSLTALRMHTNKHTCVSSQPGPIHYRQHSVISQSIKAALEDQKSRGAQECRGCN